MVLKGDIMGEGGGRLGGSCTGRKGWQGAKP